MFPSEIYTIQSDSSGLTAGKACINYSSKYLGDETSDSNNAVSINGQIEVSNLSNGKFDLCLIM